LSRSMDSLFHAFLSSRASSGWESKTSAIRRWIMTPPRALALAEPAPT
jgi:hypothetical protein